METAKTIVASKATGKTLEVITEFFNDGMPQPNGDRGCLTSRVVVLGKPRHADWFISSQGELTCQVVFEEAGVKYQLNAKAVSMDEATEKYVADYVAREARQKAQENEYRISQMYNY